MFLHTKRRPAAYDGAPFLFMDIHWYFVFVSTVRKKLKVLVHGPSIFSRWRILDATVAMNSEFVGLMLLYFPA